MPEDRTPRAHDLSGWLRRRGWRGPRGPSQRGIRDVLRTYIQRGREAFTLREIMDEAGLDFDNRSDYIAAHTFIASMREITADFSDWFWHEPAYRRYTEDGYTDKTVFKKVVDAMTGYDIFPIFFDERIKKYRLLTLDGWVRLTRRRAGAIRTEFIRRAEELAGMAEKFLAIGEMYPAPALPTNGRFIALPGARPFQCGSCSMAFIDKASLEGHTRRRHPEQ